MLLIDNLMCVAIDGYFTRSAAAEKWDSDHKTFALEAIIGQVMTHSVHTHHAIQKNNNA
jgi:hypothetical protein